MSVNRSRWRPDTVEKADDDANSMVMRRLGLTLVALLWLLTVGWGMTRLSGFEHAAGAAGRPPAQWPLGIPVALDPTRPTLIMLAHPRCPCTRASIAEMNRLMALCPKRASVVVLFLEPKGYSEEWVQTGLWKAAAAIPGVQVMADREGKTAQRLGATTSGETLLYAQNGDLLYQGGLTGSRGHEGDNKGLDCLVALLDGRKPPAARTPAFGCPLTSERTPPSSLPVGVSPCRR